MGEHAIDEPDSQTGKYKIVNLEVIPKVEVNKDALAVIYEADVIVLGPGDFYTSILPNLVIEDVPEAIKRSKAKVIFVANLMTKFGQTVGFKASDFTREVERYLSGRSLDFCILNKNNHFTEKMLSKYKEENAEPVKDDLKDYAGKTKIVRKSLISSKVYEKSKGDILERSLIRHDSDKLAKVVVELL